MPKEHILQTSPRKTYRPLRGIRVLSFEIAFSLPAGTRTLAELGAEVVRVAGPARAAGTYIGVVDGVYLSKPCVGINLKHDSGRDIARRLVGQADVVCYNFTPETMRAFGLAPNDLVTLKPGLIVLQLTGYGEPGPWATYPAYGPSTEAAGGLNVLMGNETDDPVRIGSGVFSDQLAGRFAAVALLAALERRRQTGEGAIIDLSMTEAITTLLGGQIVGAHRTGERPARIGNRDAVYAPQGIYPAAGENEWIAITVKDDRAWKALSELTGAPELRDTGLETVGARHEAHDAIDRAVAEWTAMQDKHALAAQLQAAGVTAAPVRKPFDHHFDAHLKERGILQNVEHEAPVLGYMAHPYARIPWRVEGQATLPLTDFRYTGHDNALVLRRWLGINTTETKRLTIEGALFDSGSLTVADRPAAPGVPVDKDAGERLGLPRAEVAR